MRRRSVLILVGLLAGLAIVDVFTGWRFLILPAVAACLACAAVAGLLGARRLRLLAVSLAAACFAVHLVYSLLIVSEEGRWAELEREKAEGALASAKRNIHNMFVPFSVEVV